jgi:hypothetical protein
VRTIHSVLSPDVAESKIQASFETPPFGYRWKRIFRNADGRTYLKGRAVNRRFDVRSYQDGESQGTAIARPKLVGSIYSSDSGCTIEYQVRPRPFGLLAGGIALIAGVVAVIAATHHTTGSHFALGWGVTVLIIGVAFIAVTWTEPRRSGVLLESWLADLTATPHSLQSES